MKVVVSRGHPADRLRPWHRGAGGSYAPGQVSRMIEVAGPHRFRPDALIRRLIAETGHSRQIVTESTARGSGEQLNDRSLVLGEGARPGATRFDDLVKCVATRNLPDAAEGAQLPHLEDER